MPPHARYSHVYTHVLTHVLTHAYAHAFAHVYKHVYTHIFAYVHAPVYANVRRHGFTPVVPVYPHELTLARARTHTYLRVRTSSEVGKPRCACIRAYARMHTRIVRSQTHTFVYTKCI